MTMGGVLRLHRLRTRISGYLGAFKERAGAPAVLSGRRHSKTRLVALVSDGWNYIKNYG